MTCVPSPGVRSSSQWRGPGGTTTQLSSVSTPRYSPVVTALSYLDECGLGGSSVVFPGSLQWKRLFASNHCCHPIPRATAISSRTLLWLAMGCGSLVSSPIPIRRSARVLPGCLCALMCALNLIVYLVLQVSQHPPYPVCQSPFLPGILREPYWSLTALVRPGPLGVAW